MWGRVMIVCETFWRSLHLFIAYMYARRLLLLLLSMYTCARHRMSAHDGFSIRFPRGYMRCSPNNLPSLSLLSAELAVGCTKRRYCRARRYCVLSQVFIPTQKVVECNTFAFTKPCKRDPSHLGSHDDDASGRPAISISSLSPQRSSRLPISPPTQPQTTVLSPMITAFFLILWWVLRHPPSTRHFDIETICRCGAVYIHTKRTLC